MNNESFGRFMFVGAVFSILSIVLVWKIFFIQANEGYGELNDKAKNYEVSRELIYPERGLIYDRWGHILAGNKQVIQLGLDLQDVINPVTIASVLASEAGLNYNDVFAKASTPFDEINSAFIDLRVYVEPETWQRLQDVSQQLNLQASKYKKGTVYPSLRGLVGTPRLIRYYPEHELASNVIGFYTFLNNDGSEDMGAGFYGVEAYYNDLLAGKPQYVTFSLDPGSAQAIPGVISGASVILTIDREIQAMVEEKLDAAVKANKAESGTIVVLNPRNGEIIAMASTPRMDLNKYWKVKDIFPGETPYNRAISQAYEPGSVFKILTMVAAVDSGAVQPDTTMIDSGSIEVGGIRIFNWDRAGHGQVSMQTCMELSLNVCLAWVATQMGNNSFYEYMQRFMVGERTNVDLAGETFFPMRLPGGPMWTQVDLGVNSFGQGLSVTPLQIAMASSAIANKGVMMAPHVAKAIIQDGVQHERPPQSLGQVIKPEAAEALTQMLAQSVRGETYEALDSLTENYSVAGKTGTGEIALPGIGYGTNLTNTSFVGWGPVDDPQYLVYVWIEQPRTSMWGSQVAAPVFRDVVKELVVLLDVPPDKVREEIKRR